MVVPHEVLVIDDRGPEAARGVDAGAIHRDERQMHDEHRDADRERRQRLRVKMKPEKGLDAKFFLHQ